MKAVLILMIALLLTGCSGGEQLKTVDGTPIPANVVYDKNMIMEARKVVGPLAWQVYRKAAGYEWYALRYMRERDGKLLSEWSIRAISTSKDEWKLGVGFETKTDAFYGTHTSQTVGLGGRSICNLLAAGIANDARIVQVVGTTINGDVTTTVPVNSCWILICEDTSVANKWSSVEAKDASGNTIYSWTFSVPYYRPTP